MRDTHRAAADLITATGATFAVSPAGCCGALHVHAGLVGSARKLAERVVRSMPGDAPILVDSAGCGAAMKDYGRLLGTADAVSFAARVVDIHEWLAERVDLLPSPSTPRAAVIVQDPCHLRHVQRVHGAVRTVLGHVADVVELDDDGVCCGAGGAYSALQPALAGEIRARKLDAIGRARAQSGARIVASANPGCAMHLAAAGVDVRHPVDIVAEALRLMSRFDDLAERLEAIVGELDELSFDLLQQAVADGATQRPAADRSLTQARRAVEKAASLLRQAGEPDA